MSKVPAAENTLRILAYLATQRGPVPAAAIAASLGLPRSTVYHLLTVLAEHGFVLHLPEARRYGLGVAAYELSSGFSRQQPLSRLGRPIVAALVDAIGESGHVAVLHGRDVVYNLLLVNQWFPDVNIVDFAYWTVPVQIAAFIA